MLQFLSLFSIALALVNALTIPEKEQADLGLTKRAPAPLKLDFDVVRTAGLNSKARWTQVAERHAKRLQSVPIVDRGDVSYTLNIFLGSDSQEINVILDTGSSDLWVYEPSASGSVGGTYDSLTSSGYLDTGELFLIGYVDGSTSSGEYVLDDFSFLDTPLLTKFQFAEVTSGDNNNGILGVAGFNQESVRNGEPTYNNLPHALAQAGVIPKASYSLYLGEEGGTGSIIFGGIDTDKYTGLLALYPISSKQGLSLNVATIDVDGKSFTENTPYILDSGTSWNLVPQNVLDYLNTVFPSTTEVDLEGYLINAVSCDQPTDKYITFTLGLTPIQLSYADAIVRDGDYCLLGFETYQEYSILGDVFLRKAYVYYDLTDLTISIAPVKYSTSSNIISA